MQGHLTSSCTKKCFIVIWNTNICGLDKTVNTEPDIYLLLISLPNCAAFTPLSTFAVLIKMKWFALLSLFLLASLTFVEVDSEDIDEEDSDGDGVPDEEDEDDDNDGIPDDGKVDKECFCRSFFICKLLFCLRSYHLFLFCCNPSCFAL